MQTESAGKQHMIAFASHALTLAEKNYSVTHLRDSGHGLGTATFSRHHHET